MKPYSIIAKRSWIIAALALAAADADGDGFPDEGAEPVIHLEGLEGSAKRI